MPFVFARWVVRRDLPPEVKSELIERIDASLESGWQNFEKVVDAKGHELGMSVDEMYEYLNDFHFRMTTEAHEAVNRFRQLDGALHPGDAATTAQGGL
jgi:predicted solute-binding protein